ncbi:MAG: HlyD family efflux transporter periplasmic adaptor subunit [Woeseia sp.]
MLELVFALQARSRELNDPSKNTSRIRPGLARPAAPAGDASPLFRAEAVRAAREPLHGRVAIVMPPSTVFAAGLCLLSLALLALAAFVVEVPQRAPAVGVLMPPGGFLKIVALEPGQVIDLRVSERELVAAGQPLVTLGSDRNAVDRAPLSASQIRSLENELGLQRIAARERQRIQASRMAAVDDEVANADVRLGIVAMELEIQTAQSRLLRSRYDRLARLASEGNVSSVQRDDAELQLLQAQAAAAVLRRQVARIGQEREQLLRARTGLADESGLQQIDSAIAGERLLRQVAALEAVVNRHLQAPREAVVARIGVRPGQVVQAGQTLMMLHKKDAQLEAWLYLSSTNAGSLQAGQAVELRLDAYPHQMFGTQRATVASISGLALLPSELDVPLALGGPVFEVRATLERQYVRARGKDWPLIAGTSFRADVVQQRYRLYEWLLRLRRDPAESSPADSVKAADA